MRTLIENRAERILKNLGLPGPEGVQAGASSGPNGWSDVENREILESISPVDGRVIGRIALCNAGDYTRILEESQAGFRHWRSLPAPQRGQIIRRIGDRLREHKRELAELISLEVGKILPESEGEIQEMIDIADFALGLSRQLYGLTIQSERENHRLYEQWLPLGPVGIITSFNFPTAVYRNIRVGDPFEPGVLCGPLVDGGRCADLKTPSPRLRKRAAAFWRAAG